jgi:heme/copper-type cytochrome/quinol oxidase subunit 2
VRYRWITAALTAGLVVSSCSTTDGDDGGPDNPVIEGASELLVEGSSFEYSPSEVDIAAGEAVNVVLSSSDIEHDFTIDEADFQVMAGGGKTAETGLLIDQPGTSTAYCSIPGHQAAGMEIPVIVR